VEVRNIIGGEVNREASTWSSSLQSVIKSNGRREVEEKMGISLSRIECKQAENEVQESCHLEIDACGLDGTKGDVKGAGGTFDETFKGE
jgi:hypothetical protein